MDYQKWFCERPIAMGGSKVWDLRRVEIRSSEEERQFLAAVNYPKELMSDVVNSQSQWGARGLHLADLIAERKQMLKDMVDQDLLEVEEPLPDLNPDPAAPSDGEVQPRQPE